ncbi:hypothetical protein BH11PSE3_BH11PSE3_23820 [soil metagenome]
MSTIDAFRGSITAAQPPADASPALQGLWWMAKGDWDRAHQCVQGHEGQADCDWVHAHLHRQEGDLSNANYWYRRAAQPLATVSLPDEWTAIAGALIARVAQTRTQGETS